MRPGVKASTTCSSRSAACRAETLPARERHEVPGRERTDILPNRPRASHSPTRRYRPGTSPAKGKSVELLPHLVGQPGAPSQHCLAQPHYRGAGPGDQLPARIFD